MKLSPQQILSLTGGFGAIVVVLGFSAYIWFALLTLTPVRFTQTSFPLTGAQNLLTSANLIKRAAQLVLVPLSQPDKVKFAPTDIGKVDLTKLE